MASSSTQFLDSPAGKAIAVIFGIGALVGAIYVGISSFSGNSVAATANQRMFVDAKTGLPFPHELTLGEMIPIKAPSGGNTGYPAEPCNWTADGKPGTKITYVLMNDWIGKPGPTYCPDCKRRVSANNPVAVEGAKPPPTEAESRQR
jgi:hypothetical protein